MSATASEDQLVLSCSESGGKSHQLLRPYLSQLYAYQMGGDTDTHKQGAQAAGVLTPRGCASSQLICSRPSCRVVLPPTKVAQLPTTLAEFFQGWFATMKPACT